MTLDEVRTHIRPLDQVAYKAARFRLDQLTKPVGSLGRLEELAADYVAMTGIQRPAVPSAVVYTFVGDHGIAKHGVSAYPREVTQQMLLNFLRGGAAVNVLAAHVGAAVRVVDMGVAADLPPLPGLIRRKIAPGTEDFAAAPAMTRQQAAHAVEIGIELAGEAAREGIGLFGCGDMGIGNTTASAAVTAVMTGQSVPNVTGRGTGIDDDILRRKIDLISSALEYHCPDRHDALDVLAKVGGFEIAGITGLILGSAAARVPVVLDGFIAGAAALLAVGLAPRCRDYLIASHESVECGHRAILGDLRLKPLLNLDLRLGEGTGACLGIGLLQAALKLYLHMATFDEAAVAGRCPSGAPA
jgi:nicotinate-nucleotide--dimethylbenzimidazole phosphoribosyltransferase